MHLYMLTEGDTRWFYQQIEPTAEGVCGRVVAVEKAGVFSWIAD
jgi:hypothetical protein